MVPDSGGPTFLGAGRWQPGDVRDVVVVGIPSSTASRAPSHADRGPDLLRRVSAVLRQPSPQAAGWYDVARDRLLCTGVDVADAGDLIPSVEGAQRPDKLVIDSLRELRGSCRLLVVLLGDDSWTYEVMSGQRGRLLHLDAHEDRSPGRPTVLDHANHVAHILDSSPDLTIGQWGRRGLQPGPPGPTPGRYRRLARPAEAVTLVAGGEGGESPTHIALDVDVIDPREMSSVTCPLPGGLSVRQVEEICVRARRLQTLSVAEFAPRPGSRSGAIEAYMLIELLVRVMHAAVGER